MAPALSQRVGSRSSRSSTVAASPSGSSSVPAAVRCAASSRSDITASSRRIRSAGSFRRRPSSRLVISSPSTICGRVHAAAVEQPGEDRHQRDAGAVDLDAEIEREAAAFGVADADVVFADRLHAARAEILVDLVAPAERLQRRHPVGDEAPASVRRRRGRDRRRRCGPWRSPPSAMRIWLKPSWRSRARASASPRGRGARSWRWLGSRRVAGRARIAARRRPATSTPS